MKIIEKVEAWGIAIGEEWDAKPAREKNIIALIGTLLAFLGALQLALGASQ